MPISQSLYALFFLNFSKTLFITLHRVSPTLVPLPFSITVFQDAPSFTLNTEAVPDGTYNRKQVGILLAGISLLKGSNKKFKSMIATVF